MFKSLVCAVSEQCQEIKQAMGLFPYFEDWDAKVVAECCRVSSLVEFPPNAVILGPGTGDAQAAHFVVKGQCKMVQHLEIEASTNSHGRVMRKLRQASHSRTSDSETKNERYLSRLFNEREEERNERAEKEKGAEATPQREGNGENSERLVERAGTGGKILLESEQHLKVLRECRKRRAEAMGVLRRNPLGERPENVESVFVESGVVLSGGCFGLDKSQREGFVMAWTPVKVLKIPLRFLLQHNPCNIWNRISLFHALHLFEDEKVFQYFQSNRRWAESKERQTEQILSFKNIPNYTSPADVPYSIRLTTTR